MPTDTGPVPNHHRERDDMKTKNQVAKWLKSIRHTQSIRPCVVTIGTDTYEGAMYEGCSHPIRARIEGTWRFLTPDGF
jgi:hypothetical protein